MIKNTIALLFIFLSMSIMAQEMGSCGTVTTPEQMQAFYNRDKSHMHKSSASLVRIPVVYHIIGTDAGTGQFEMDDLLDLHCNVSEDFAPADIEFVIIEVRYINDDYFYNFDDFNNANNDNPGGVLMNMHNVNSVCNIYLTPNAKSGSTPVCGYSFTGGGGPNNGGIVLDNSCATPGSSTLSHEMGHYLNLNHTFFGWEGQDEPDGNSPAPTTIGWWEANVEKVARTNCEISGDGFCGTLPDYISDRWNCNANGESQEFQDPDGVVFRVDGSNFMSYADDGCHNYFAADQMAEMNAAPANYRPYLLLMNIENYLPVDAPADIIFPEDGADNLTPSGLELKWNSVENADYYFVQLAFNNFFNTAIDTIVSDTSLVLFNLNEDDDYIWRVHAYNNQYTCDNYTAQRSFSTANFSGSVQVIPPSCPGQNDANVSFSDPLGGDEYSWSSMDPFLNAQVQSQTAFNINNIQTGEYKLEVERNGEILVVNFSIVDPPVVEVEFVDNGIYILANISGGTPPYSTIAWNNGEAGPINDSPIIGTNSVTIIDSKGCIYTKSVEYTGVAIEDEEIALNMAIIYPNPLQNNILNIEMSLIESENVHIEVFNISGQRIANQDNTLSAGII